MDLRQNDLLVLNLLKDGRQKTAEEIVAALKMDQVAVSKSILGLQENELVKVDERKTISAKVTEEGKRVLSEGLPEKLLILELTKGRKKMTEIKLLIQQHAVGWAKKKGYVEVKGDQIFVTKQGMESMNKQELELLLLKKMTTEGLLTEQEAKLLGERKLVEYFGKIIRIASITDKGKAVASNTNTHIETGATKLTPELIKTGKWKETKFLKYNVTATAKSTYPGKRHFKKQAMEYVRKIWLEMGFKEMSGSLIQTAFWNFDALFIPQEHSAREMQDTFFIEGKGELPHSKIVQNVKKAHEIGIKDSCGWSYDWNPEKSKQLVLRTHTTVLSAQTIAKLKESDLPAKFFSIGRVFRNEALDWKHLFEFNQVEGIVVDPNANFRQLIGYLKEFYKKMGFEKIRIRPSYFPYTEMSCEVEVWHPQKKLWLELGGAGIFRPEVVEPLIGKPIPVLAWGLGLGRILMDYYKLTDVRDLYRNDIKQLRDAKQWMIG